MYIARQPAAGSRRAAARDPEHARQAVEPARQAGRRQDDDNRRTRGRNRANSTTSMRAAPQRDGDVDDHCCTLGGTISSLGCIDYRHDEWGGRCGGRRIASMASAWLEVDTIAYSCGRPVTWRCECGGVSYGLRSRTVAACQRPSTRCQCHGEARETGLALNRTGGCHRPWSAGRTRSEVCSSTPMMAPLRRLTLGW